MRPLEGAGHTQTRPLLSSNSHSASIQLPSRCSAAVQQHVCVIFSMCPEFVTNSHNRSSKSCACSSSLCSTGLATLLDTAPVVYGGTATFAVSPCGPLALFVSAKMIESLKFSKGNVRCRDDCFCMFKPVGRGFLC